MLGCSGPEVIDLLSDDDSFLDAGDESVVLLEEAMPETPVRNVRGSSSGWEPLVATPGTPDLPSPSALLDGLTHSRRTALGSPLSSSYSRQEALGSPIPAQYSRQAALDLPSSPPALSDSDESLNLLRGCSPVPATGGDESDGLEDGWHLDDLIRRRGEPHAKGGLGASDEAGESSLPKTKHGAGPPSMVPGRPPYVASVEYSDAVATEILDSSSSPSDSSDGELDVLDTSGNGSGDLRLFSSRSLSANTASSRPGDVHLISTDPACSALGSDAAAGSDAGRRETAAARRRREAEQRRAEREAARQQREREREEQRGIGSVNRMHVDAAAVARDMTVVVDPLVRALAGDAALEALREGGATVREEAGAVAGAVAWEAVARRQWDHGLGLYVPVREPRASRVRAAAMVVVDAARFTGLVASGRIDALLDIWRAALAARRLLVAVLGLQKLLRQTAGAEMRAFARQMRTHMRGGPANEKAAAPPPPPAISTDAAEEAVLRLQLTRPWAAWLTQCADGRALGRVLWQTTVDVGLAEFCAERPAPGSNAFVGRDGVAALHAAAVRSGADLPDAWARALALIPRVTQPVAQAIVAQHATPRRLFAAWRAAGSVPAAELLLAPLVVPGGRRVGAAMSTRIYRVFNEADAARPVGEL
ncbi:hypothetical protein GGI02_004305 [Coemansia sp. RSA 2322]|nr:hypothetical protein GGI02_004305 [Coemansia sp. RSA 2322]